MMASHPTRQDGWAKIIGLTVPMLVLSIDTSSVPHRIWWFWHVSYGLSALAVLSWKLTGRLGWLVVFRYVLCSVCLVRAGLFVLEGDRWAGAALNQIVCVYTWGYVRNRNYERLTA